ncbi:MAG: hypothetical protein ACAF41_12400 [Leptolyngbya sp. BL-A-14]
MSNFTLKRDMQCAHCSHLTVGYSNPNTVFGGSDLDTRPSEHPTPEACYRCARCGYCAYDLSASLPNLAAVLASAEYQTQLTNDAYSELIQNFFCAALLYEQAEMFVDAGWVYVNVAWISDDDGCTDLAQACRLQAVDRFEQAIAAGGKLSQTPGAEALFLSDLLRRAGAFDRALAYCDAGLATAEEKLMQTLLHYEKTLIRAQDQACHTGAEAVQSVVEG